MVRIVVFSLLAVVWIATAVVVFRGEEPGEPLFWAAIATIGLSGVELAGRRVKGREN